MTDLTDAEYGEVSTTNGNGHRGGGVATPPSPNTLKSKRWGYILCLSLGVLFIAFEIMVHSNVELEDVVGVMHTKRESYEPLVGRNGEKFEDFPENNSIANVNDHSALDMLASVKMETEPDISNLGGTPSGSEEQDTPPPSDTAQPLSEDKKHPRVTCFMASMHGNITGFMDSDKDRYDCQVQIKDEIKVDVQWPPSMPKKIDNTGGKSSSSSEDYNDIFSDESKDCKLSDPSYQSILAAPSTCNDVHALPFRFGPTDHEPLMGINPVYPSRHQIKYLTSGAFRAVWTVTQLDDSPEIEERVIMKTNRVSRGWSAYDLDKNRRDILISERGGSSPMLQPLHSNLLPVYQYCAFSSIVPFSTAGPLDEYVKDRVYKKDLFSATEQYLLALQAARGLYQAQLYAGGKATHVHADVKPPQFLLFNRGTNARIDENSVPVMQINDFNRGKFLTRDVNKNNATCPFRMCSVRHKGSTYRSPEEYMKCADQADTIDVFSLGGVFFYLLSDGKKPWYHKSDFDSIVEKILNGENPRLPYIEEYKKYDKETIAMVEERSKHPAFIALKEVMTKCWEFKPEDRPSSLQVVQMLEEKWNEINPSAEPKWWSKWRNKF